MPEKSPGEQDSTTTTVPAPAWALEKNPATAPVMTEDFKTTFERVQKEWNISEIKLQELMEKFDTEKWKLLDRSQANINVLLTDISKDMLKNWITVKKNDLKWINKILQQIDSKYPIIDAKNLPEWADTVSFVGTVEEIWVYRQWWIHNNRLWIIKAWKYEEDSLFTRAYKSYDVNYEGNDNKSEFGQRAIEVEKVPEPPKDFVKNSNVAAIETPAEEVKTITPLKVNLKKEDLKYEWSTPYTTINYSKYIERINQLNFAQVEWKEELINALKNPTKDNIEKLQTIIGVKLNKKPEIDWKFWDRTWNALNEYVVTKTKEAQDKLAAAQSTLAKWGEASVKVGEKTTDWVEKQAVKVDAQASAKVVWWEHAAVAEKAPAQPDAKPATPTPAPATGWSK